MIYPPGEQPLRTFEEVAQIMTANGHPITQQAAWHAEKRAFRKLREDPTLRKLFAGLTDVPPEDSFEKNR